MVDHVGASDKMTPREAHGVKVQAGSVHTLSPPFLGKVKENAVRKFDFKWAPRSCETRVLVHRKKPCSKKYILDTLNNYDLLGIY